MKISSIVSALLIGLSLFYTGCSRVEPGYAGIKVDLYGSTKGVQEMPIVTGMVFYNPITTNIIEYPCFTQTAIWTKDIEEGSPKNEEITFNTVEGLTVSGDISLSYQLKAESVPSFYTKFRSDNINDFTHGFLRNTARDAFNEVGATFKVEDVYGTKKEELLKQVKARLNANLSEYGIVIEQFGFVGALRIPEGVTQALNSKIKATQDAIRVENELRSAEAEAKKTVAKAEGEALANVARTKGQSEANLLLSQSITPELLKWQEMQITLAAIEKWNGVRPMVEGGNSGLLLQIPVNK